MSISNIIWKIPFLVKHTHVDDVFISSLLVRGLITDEVIRDLKIKKGGINSPRFSYSLLQEVDKQGELAVEQLVDVLLETGNIEAAKLLAPRRVENHLNQEMQSDPNNQTQTPVCSEMNGIGKQQVGEQNGEIVFPEGCVWSVPKSVIENDEHYTQEPHAQETPLCIKVVPATYVFKTENTYRIGPGAGRGLALIINNENFQDPDKTRKGSQVDSANLTTLLTQIGFQVSVKSDLTKTETLQLLIDFSENQKHKSGDVMVLAVLSHGIAGGKIVTQDGKTVDINYDILRGFKNENCPFLRGKPKVFIIQACQGDEWDMGLLAKGLGDQTDARPSSRCDSPGSPFKDPSWEDMVISFSTVPGYVSWRNTIRGSWFIETICMVFMECSYNTNLRDMLDLVGLKLKHRESEQGAKQSSEYTVRGFHKKLFLYPGLDVPEDQLCLETLEQTNIISNNKIS